MGEIIELSRYNELRLLRYQMQAAAKYILPDNRVGICLRYQIEKFGIVDVYKNLATQKVFYGGLMVCGSVWVCPVCAAKISERRRVELRRAFDLHRANGGYCTMMTLTFSHQRTDRLADNMDALAEAMKRFRSGKVYFGLMGEIGLIGTIRTFEITYGENGWHPHIHLLMFHRTEVEAWEIPVLESRFYNLWSAVCGKVGLKASRQHGLRLDDAAEADEYIGKWGDLVKSKWGVDREMTKANSKKGRVGSMTPFDFLRVISEVGGISEEVDMMYVPHYKEYAAATKGKRQLVWSKGLKEMFEIEERTDEEVAAAKEEPADRLGGIGWEQWRYIVRNDLRGQLQDLIESKGYDTAIDWLAEKSKKTPQGNGVSKTTYE